MTVGQGGRDILRLAEPIAALSMVTDAARGRPPEDAMRACLVATALARAMGLAEPEVADVYYTTLLRSVGCTATSHEYADAFGGDDVEVRRRGDALDPTASRDVLSFVWDASRRPTPLGRVRALATTARIARRVTTDGARADCEVGARMARGFGLAQPVESALLQGFERWDGKGVPDGVAGNSIALPARFAAAAYAFVIFETLEREARRAILREWAGKSLDPDIANELARQADLATDAAQSDDAWAAVLAAEPAPTRRIDAGGLDDVAMAFANAVDLKSPFLHGHSRGVATIAEHAAVSLGIPADAVTDVRRAGLLHDLGRAGIATGIWEKAGPLTTAEWEQVRLHAYHTERILSRAPALSGLARLAGMHHERLDASGYHRGAPASTQSLAVRILAAADVYQALIEDRPHRPAISAAEAARRLALEPLDTEVVRAVVEAVGEQPPRRGARPGGITDRELDVIRRLVRGRSEKEIAAELVLSAATVHTHTINVYRKAGVSTRAGLAMFAMENDLIRPDDPQGDRKIN